MHEIKFPAHTQARMDAAMTAKAAKTEKPVDEVAGAAQADQVIPPTQMERKPRGLPGHMDTLDSDGRRAILESSERVAIAYGTAEDPLILVDKVNMAILRHCECYVPQTLTLTLQASQNIHVSDPAQDN